MRVLIAYYSRTGYTGTLAQRIAEELKSRGHEVVFERIETARQKSQMELTLQAMYQYPTRRAMSGFLVFPPLVAEALHSA